MNGKVNGISSTRCVGCSKYPRHSALSEYCLTCEFQMEDRIRKAVHEREVRVRRGNGQCPPRNRGDLRKDLMAYAKITHKVVRHDGRRWDV